MSPSFRRRRMGDCVITVVSGGRWRSRKTGWFYEGQQVSFGLLTPESIGFEELVKMVRRKVGVHDNTSLKLCYYPCVQPGIPPIYISCDDDLEVYKFSNANLKVFSTPMYCAVEDVVTPKTEEVEVLSGAHDHYEPKHTMSGFGTDHGRKQQFGSECGKKKTEDIEVVSLLSDDEMDDCEAEQEEEVDLTGPDLTGPEDKHGKCSTEGNHIDLSNGSSDGSDDSYLWWDRFKTQATSRNHTGDWSSGSGPSRVVVDLDKDDDSSKDDRNDGEELDPEFWNQLNAAELRAMRQHHPYREANVEDEVGVGNSTELRMGGLYDGKESLKLAIADYAVNNGFETRVKRSEPMRLFVGCKVLTCKFQVNAATVPLTNKFKVKKFIKDHSCGLKFSHKAGRKVSTSFIANKILARYNVGKKILSPSAIQIALKSGGLDVSYNKASRARKVAEAMVRGTPEDSFMYMHSWLEMLKQMNPGTYTAIETDDDGRFKSCFWALGCTIRAYPNFRKVVTVDGAHLSGKYPGVPVMAVLQDPNNHIYPIAFSIVGSECNTCWSFFFKHLKASGAVPDEKETIIISDRHHSIERSMQVHYKMAGHGVCAYHLYHNLRSYVVSFGGGSVQDQWFCVAKAFTVEDFNREMGILKEMAPRMAEKALEVPIESWARAYCRRHKYNIMTTNNSESMNSVVKEERRWPVIALFNAILESMSRWFNQYRMKPGSNDADPAHKVAVTMDLRHMQSLSLIARKRSQDVAEVTEGFRTFEVDLRRKTCQCEVFQKERIPCRHAFAAAGELKVSAMELLSPLYLNRQLKAMYKEVVRVVPQSRSQWTVPARVKCMPPLWARGPGRPRVNRYKAAWERRRCTICKRFGHLAGQCYSRRT